MAFIFGLVWGLIIAGVIMSVTSRKFDPDLRRIQQQRDAMRLYNETLREISK